MRRVDIGSVLDVGVHEVEIEQISGHAGPRYGCFDTGRASAGAFQAETGLVSMRSAFALLCGS